MTPLMITLFIVAGVALLIAIGFLNNVVENNKVEKTRLKHELADRLRRCAEITETFPGQFMTPELKSLMARLELNINQRLLALDKSNAALKGRIEELKAEVEKGTDIEVPNPPAPIQTEAKAKDISYQLELLHHQIIRATQEGFLQAAESKQWVNQVRHILVLLHIEFFNSLGQQAFQEAQPGHARLAFERGVQYLRKQPEPSVYAEQLRYMEKLLARANSMVLNEIQPTEDDVNELTEGLKEAEEQTEWKKRVIYD